MFDFSKISSNNRAPEVNRTFKKTKVLLADNNFIFRQTIKELLVSQGQIEIVGEAEDGWQAVQKARELLPQVILMDIRMPKMNGLKATRRIKKEFPSIGVIVLTLYDNLEYQTEAEKSGADGYLSKKTLSAASLVRTIEKVS